MTDSSPLKNKSNRTSHLSISGKLNYVNTLLSGVIFLGRYIERKLVPQIGYRDLVLVSEAETELLEIFDELKLLLQNELSSCNVITSECFNRNEQGVCLWTTIENQPFGIFWFEMEGVELKENGEVIVEVKCIRQIAHQMIELPILSNKSDVSMNFEFKTPNIDHVKSYLMTALKSMVSISNIKTLILFIFTFIVTLFSTASAFIYFLGEFGLMVYNELSMIIYNAETIYSALVELCYRAIRGFYLVLLIIFPTHNPRSIYAVEQSNDGKFD